MIDFFILELRFHSKVVILAFSFGFHVNLICDDHKMNFWHAVVNILENSKRLVNSLTNNFVKFCSIFENQIAYRIHNFTMKSRYNKDS